MSDQQPPSVRDEIETVRVRRSPKYGVFLALGAALGLLVAMILTFAFDGTAMESPNSGMQYSTTQVFGFVTLICVPVGIALAGALALILDRVVGRRTRDVRVDHESVNRPG
ncbi:potassium transporter Trk [Microbacterium lushaniae]|uniref:Potassium transporter Trk n=1 Tax=Microbacterium lushaniae TaxID=2614639 RepID=A0A5J6KZY0_9MICO|nr:potassium transporter Trk [Microbacterium lushaniae]QEW01752.1 potassium transporter Trk [Microbacterium lushaniae]